MFKWRFPMFGKNILMTALCVSAVGMTGCSTATTAWNSMGDLVQGVTGVAKSAFLRGPSKKSDVSFAEAVTPTTDGGFKTDVGTYVPTETNVEVYTDTNTVDTSPHPCPEGTYLTADNTCLSTETDTYDFPDLTTDTAQVVDTSPVPCPEGTYLTADNTCLSTETDTYDFGDDLNANVNQVIDTSPHPCPEGTYLTAENSCMFLETEPLDFASETPTINTAVNTAKVETTTSLVTTPVENTVTKIKGLATNASVDCPPGFKKNADNSCMFLGKGTDTGN